MAAKNLSNTNDVKAVSFEQASAEAIRKSSGKHAGHLLMFCACPLCGSRMKQSHAFDGDGYRGGHFLCENHSADWIIPAFVYRPERVERK